MKKQFVGYIFIITPLIITTLLWLVGKEEIYLLMLLSLETFTEMCALLGMVLMALSILLTTRIKIIQSLFGGLDKDYRVHAVIGSISVLFLLAHPLLLTLDAALGNTPVLRYFFLGSNMAYNFGILGIYTLLVSLVCMVFIKLPYHLWKYTHQLLVFTFIFGGLHAFIAKSDIAENIPLQIWMLFIFTLGVVSGLYMLFLYNRFGTLFQYTVHTVRQIRDIVEIYLSPSKSETQLQFSPGQFIFVKFHNKLLGNEPHPYSLSSALGEHMIRLSVKPVGDYTKKLIYLQTGDIADVYGPFGNFGNIYKKLTPHMVWIAGGIGVTPFLSMLHEESLSPQPGSIQLFYTHHSQDDGVYTTEIERLVTHTPRVTFHDWSTNSHPRLTAEEINKIVPHIKECIILICGPRVMMYSLEKQLISLGIEKDHIIFEDFSFL